MTEAFCCAADGISRRPQIGQLPREFQRILLACNLFHPSTLSPTTGARGQRSLVVRKTALVKGREEWPPHSSHGLSVTKAKVLESGVTEYTYTQGLEYQHAEQAFVMVADTHDPNRLMHVLQRYPYHLATLLQLSTVAQLMADNEQAQVLKLVLLAWGQWLWWC